jgi:hypothetical protein
MVAHGLSADLPVFRAIVSEGFMLRMKAARPDIANIVQLLVGPFGLVDPRPKGWPLRVAELQVGDVLLNIEDEYED